MLNLVNILTKSNHIYLIVLLLFSSYSSAQSAQYLEKENIERIHKVAKIQSCYIARDCAFYINAKIRQVWMERESPKSGIYSKLEIHINKDGSVKDIAILETSGSTDHDKSAIDAVNKAAPFSAIKALSKESYEKYIKVLPLYL